MVDFCHANYHRRGRTPGRTEAVARGARLQRRHRVGGDGRGRTPRGGRPVADPRRARAPRRALRGGHGRAAERGAGSPADGTRPTLTADTSAVIAALSAWHERHEQAAAALASVTALPAHVVVEAYSVLTRLPAGLAVAPLAAADVIARRFSGP